MTHFQRIKDMRNDFDKSQQNIADYLKMSVTQYRRYENGEREVPAWVMVELANYYNVTLDFLAGRTNRYQKFYKEI